MKISPRRCTTPSIQQIEPMVLPKPLLLLTVRSVLLPLSYPLWIIAFCFFLADPPLQSPAAPLPATVTSPAASSAFPPSYSQAPQFQQQVVAAANPPAVYPQFQQVGQTQLQPLRVNSFVSDVAAASPASAYYPMPMSVAYGPAPATGPVTSLQMSPPSISFFPVPQQQPQQQMQIGDLGAV